jgi:hypothetical protein
MSKGKRNPHCPVPGCVGNSPHEDDPVVNHLMELRAQPALLAGYTYAGLTALRESVAMDIKENNIYAWMTRFRQTEELYIRAIYALLVASDDQIPHFFSEMYPNGFRAIYDEVNKVAFAGHGRLDARVAGFDDTKLPDFSAWISSMRAHTYRFAHRCLRSTFTLIQIDPRLPICLWLESTHIVILSKISAISLRPAKTDGRC